MPKLVLRFRFPDVFRLPEKDAVLRQNNISVRDLPARSASVLTVIGLSGIHLPLSLVLPTVLAYLMVELWGIFVVKRILEGLTWVSYMTLLTSTLVGSAIFLRIPYEMWQIDNLATKLFAFCTLTTALIHCATVRAYHLPLAVSTGLPVVVTICVTVVWDLFAQTTPKDAAIGLIILTVMVSYITIMMIDSRKGRKLLVRAREDADAANEAKGRFLAAMSHEIRTPLNGILGIAQLMKDDAKDQEEVERADVLVDSTQALKTLVDDVLDHAKVEAGKLTLKPVAGNLQQTADAIIRLFRTNAQDKGLWIKLDVAPDLPEQMMFDPVRVRQILSNLVSNAIKFTDHGGVTIGLSLADEDDTGFQVHASVTDTGAGIAEEVQPRLFQRFSQVDDKDERAATGTGLGLAISQGLAELMEGRIDIDSSVGEGSTFQLSFRAGKPVAAKVKRKIGNASAGAGTYLNGAQILLVDDNSSNRFIARSYLKPTGAQVTEAANGKEAVNLALEGGFDAILMDMHMPVMDGAEAMGRIRAGPDHVANIPIIVLTADNSTEDQDTYLGLGMSGYLSKPLSKEALMTELTFHLKARRRPAAE